MAKINSGDRQANLERDIPKLINELVVRLQERGLDLNERQERHILDKLNDLAIQFDVVWFNFVNGEEKRPVIDQLYNELIAAIAAGGDAPITDAVYGSLGKWTDKLVNSVPGRNDNVRALHARASKSMVSELRRTGRVPAGFWGTDQDVKTLLKPYTTDSRTIDKAGRYILPAMQLDVSQAAVYAQNGINYTIVDDLRDKLNEVYKSLRDNGVTGPVNLQIPAVCRDSHWVAIQIQIDKQQIVDAKVRDSMSGGWFRASENTATNNLNSAIAASQFNDARAPMKYDGVQSNGHSCMDFTVQEVMVRAGIDNAITRAGSNESRLRRAVVAEVIRNTPDLMARAKRAQKPGTSNLGAQAAKIRRVLDSATTPEGIRFRENIDNLMSELLESRYADGDINSEYAASDEALVDAFETYKSLRKDDKTVSDYLKSARSNERAVERARGVYTTDSAPMAIFKNRAGEPVATSEVARVAAEAQMEHELSSFFAVKDCASEVRDDASSSEVTTPIRVN